MFKYQIHKLSRGGTESRSVLLEDILTSDVFGLMTYTPYELLLKPFLENITKKNPSAHFQPPNSSPVHVNFWPACPWPLHVPKLKRDSIEPDVMIEWDDCLLIVEAKYLSATDPEELLREFLVGYCLTQGNIKTLILLIDRNLSQPVVCHSKTDSKVTITDYIKRRLNELGLSQSACYSAIDSAFLWINWQTFYSMALTIVEEQAAGDCTPEGRLSINLILDLLYVLERKGLVPYETLDLGHLARHQVQIETLGNLGRPIQGSLADFSDVSLRIESLGDLGITPEGNYFIGL